jgi:hypothetical protein
MARWGSLVDVNANFRVQDEGEHPNLVVGWQGYLYNRTLGPHIRVFGCWLDCLDLTEPSPGAWVRGGLLLRAQGAPVQSRGILSCGKLLPILGV